MEDALFNLSKATASVRNTMEKMGKCANRTASIASLISISRKRRCIALESELEELVANEVHLRHAELDSLFAEVVHSIRKLSREKKQLELSIRRKVCKVALSFLVWDCREDSISV